MSGIQMKKSLGLKITEVQNEHQNDDKVERIFVEAVRDVNLQDYLIYDTTFTDEEEFSNKGQHVYRFPTCHLKAGQKAVIRIAEGKRGPIDIEMNGVAAYRFYWGRKGRIINNRTGDTLTLVEIANSKPFKVGPS